MIQEGLCALLAADAGVSAITANIFQVAIPPDLTILPALAYSLVGGSSQPTFKTSGVVRQRVQVDAFALTYKEAAQLRQAVITAVNGWQQTLGDGTNVLSAELLNPGTDFLSEERIFRCLVEFYVLYTLPTS